MYIPAYYKNENEAELLNFMRGNSFGIIISNGEEIPFATHLPFNVESGNELILVSHFSAANPQSRALKSGDKVTVIFNGPHGYVSPKHYDAKDSVPTWNYIAVHAHGEYHLLSDDEKENVLRKTIATYEPEFVKQYEALTPKYLEGMKKGIVAFSIRVTELQGKYKLSQNKTAQERERITNELDSNPATKDLAGYMSKGLHEEKKK